MTKPWMQHYDPGVPEHLDYPEITAFHYLDDAAEKYPNKACTIYRDQSITYTEMRQLSNVLAVGLVNLGVKPGDRVGIILPNIPQFILAFYGVLKAGGVVVAINPQYKQLELEYQLKDSEVDVIIALTTHRELLDEIRKTTPIQTVIYTQVEDAFDLVDTLLVTPTTIEECNPADADCWLTTVLTRSKDLSMDGPKISPNDVAIFQYSGGTTGTPKAAIGLHRNLVANTTMFRRWLVGLHDGQETVLAAIPLFHVYGMVIAMSVGMGLGASLVLVQNPRNLEELLSAIQKYRPTLFPGVPSMYQAINQHPEVVAGNYDLSSIKACISGSAPLLPEIKLRFEALTGGKLMEGYGLSEAPTATHCNPMFGENRAGSIGLPLPDVDCRIVDLDTGVDVAPGERGELIIRSPQIMRGYHNRPDEDAITLTDGWLHTGDVARMDADGYFYLVDRKKEMIKVSGFQVWPREVEEVIAMHPKVRECAVSGVPHPVKVEIVKAWVVLKPGEMLDSEEVRRWCGNLLAGYKVPAEVVFRQDLPRSTVGKVLRRELRRMHIEKIDQ
ncbi:MAG TPA: long-chain fatty acid--CoA ligase [Bellilinea sp.]|nr:long-chain fatty acid--CoA ligase [Bellilinea sp.]